MEIITIETDKLKIEITSESSQEIADTIYGLVWHKLNEGIHEGRSVNQMKIEREILACFDSHDPILKEVLNQNEVEN